MDNYLQWLREQEADGAITDLERNNLEGEYMARNEVATGPVAHEDVWRALDMDDPRPRRGAYPGRHIPALDLEGDMVTRVVLDGGPPDSVTSIRAAIMRYADIDIPEERVRAFLRFHQGDFDRLLRDME